MFICTDERKERGAVSHPFPVQTHRGSEWQIVRLVIVNGSHRFTRSIAFGCGLSVLQKECRSVAQNRAPFASVTRFFWNVLGDHVILAILAVRSVHKGDV